MRLFATGLLASLAWCAIASAEDFRPASFEQADPKRRFTALIEFPKVDRDISLVVNCVALVEPDGKMDRTGCFMRDQFDTPYAAAVQKAAKKARLTPAAVDGREVEIYLQFRVEFKAEGDDRIINLQLNPGYEENVNAYGYDHIAGQRVIEDRRESWQSVCPRHAKFGVWVRAYLGEDGRADSTSIEHSDGVLPIEGCREAIMQQVRDSRFIPAYSEGMPVPSTYVEPFSN